MEAFLGNFLDARSTAILLLITVAGIAVLVKGAGWLVDGAVGLSERLGIPKVIIGATVVSIGTTTPEAAVSVMAAWAGEPGLALGNGIGSIIADTGLIFGLGCMLTTLPADRYVLARQGWVQFGSATLLAILCYGGFWIMGDRVELGRWVGLLFLVLLAAYLWLSVKWSRNAPTEPIVEEKSPMIKLLVLILAGLSLVLLASHVMINSVTVLAESHWHVPQIVIAGTLVALGTSMPELVIGLTSIVKGQPELLVGNIIGADILNVLFVIGASAVAAPLPILEAQAKIPMIALYVHIPTMLIVLALFRIFIFRAGKAGQFKRWNGVPLVAIYVAYTVVQFVIS